MGEIEGAKNFARHQPHLWFNFWTNVDHADWSHWTQSLNIRGPALRIASLQFVEDKNDALPPTSLQDCKRSLWKLTITLFHRFNGLRAVDTPNEIAAVIVGAHEFGATSMPRHWVEILDPTTQQGKSAQCSEMNSAVSQYLMKLQFAVLFSLSLYPIFFFSEINVPKETSQVNILLAIL